MSINSPAKADAILKRQNESEALRLLLLQRARYSSSKAWFTSRIIGFSFVALVFPVIAILRPDLSIPLGVVVGVCALVSRIFLKKKEDQLVREAASLQYEFESFVFDLPKDKKSIVKRKPEYLSMIAENEQLLLQKASAEKVLNWYVGIDPKDDLYTAAAVSQRQSASYTSKLLSSALVFWAAIAAALGVGILSLCVAAGVTLSTFLFGLLGPLIPTVLDALDLLKGFSQVPKEYQVLEEEITEKLQSGKPVKKSDVKKWQDALFDVRVNAPIVPDWLYKILRKSSEREAKVTAKYLLDKGKT